MSPRFLSLNVGGCNCVPSKMSVVSAGGQACEKASLDVAAESAKKPNDADGCRLVGEVPKRSRFQL